MQSNSKTVYQMQQTIVIVCLVLSTCYAVQDGGFSGSEPYAWSITEPAFGSRVISNTVSGMCGLKAGYVTSSMALNRDQCLCILKYSTLAGVASYGDYELFRDANSDMSEPYPLQMQQRILDNAASFGSGYAVGYLCGKVINRVLGRNMFGQVARAPSVRGNAADAGLPRDDSSDNHVLGARPLVGRVSPERSDPPIN
eukprot:87563_1